MFTDGFKTAAFDHNNQGLEFKMSDQGNPMVGPGGMGPSGDETYQPADKTVSAKKEDRKVTARKIINKLYKFGAGLSDSGGSDIASGTVDQLKWTPENDISQEKEADDRKELKNKRKSYLRARIRE